MKIFKSIKEWCKDKIEDIKYDYEYFKESPDEIYKKPIRVIRNFFYRLKRSTKWFVRTWNTYDFDSYYLLVMIVQKLKDMRYQFDVIDSNIVDLRHQPARFNNNSDESDTVDLLAPLDRAIELGERLIESDYIRYTPNVEEYFANNNIFSNDSKMPENVREELKMIYDDADFAENKDREEFYDILKQYTPYWWS